LIEDLIKLKLTIFFDKLMVQNLVPKTAV
jgi:hypothetical protein